MNNYTTRRKLIAATGISTLAMALNTSNIVDKHSEWLEEWKQLQLSWYEADTNGNFDNLKCVNLENSWRHLGKLICETPAKTIEGIYAKLQYLKIELNENSENQWDDMLFGIQSDLIEFE